MELFTFQIPIAGAAGSAHSHVAGKDFLILKPITRVLGLLRWRPAPSVKTTKAGAVRALRQLVGAEILRYGYPAAG